MDEKNRQQIIEKIAAGLRAMSEEPSAIIVNQEVEIDDAVVCNLPVWHSNFMLYVSDDCSVLPVFNRSFEMIDVEIKKFTEAFANHKG